jgi:hypothetical protein
MKDEIELYLPKDHNVAQDIIIPPGVEHLARVCATVVKWVSEQAGFQLLFWLIDRCVLIGSATKVVHPSEFTPERQPQLQPALLRLSAMTSGKKFLDYVTKGFNASLAGLKKLVGLDLRQGTA